MNVVKVRKYLLIGLFGALLSTASDLVLGWATYPEAQGLYVGMLASAANMSYMQLALGALMGALGIPLHAFGLWGIAAHIASSAPRCSRLVKAGAGATAMFGGSVHITCAVMLLIIRIACNNGFDPAAAPDLLAAIPESGLHFTAIVLAGVSLACMIPFMLGAAALFAAAVRGRTHMPRWLCVFTPLVGMMLLEMVTMVLPNTEFCNGLRMAGLGFSDVWTFAGWLLALRGRRG